ncbi:MAG TPA: DNA gyrase subunit B, partial [Pseudidiomarina sp.]|nr:DNA gyrase subunit B [Pseudidiomarina sp.]
ERGYMYIAQPPLYKVKKGKQEQYIKDEPGLIQYLTSLALDGASLHVNAEAPGISGAHLETLVNDYQLAQNSIKLRLSRRMPETFLQRLVYAPRLTEEMLKNQSSMIAWAETLQGDLTTREINSASYTLRIEHDAERNLYLPVVVVRQHGVDTDYPMNYEFLMGRDYDQLVSIGEKIDGLVEAGGFVRRGEKEKPVDDFVEAVEWLINESKRGIYVQRYKGLGEMNPDQLWETTMDPATRRMLRVTIEDAIAADQLFTTLMGDDVEPRRNFIETNALKVANLDV